MHMPGVATGKHFAAVMCTDAELESDVIASGSYLNVASLMSLFEIFT